MAGSILVGRFDAGAVEGEELVVGVRGIDDVEIHCHGGAAAVNAIVEALAGAGCRPLGAREWLNTAETDPSRAAAAMALADARTARTAGYLLDQYHGALSAAIEQIELWLEGDERGRARDAIAELLERADLGRHLTRPWRVVLAGRPNAGKSSLMNAILGYQRSIVFEEPGTTRDVLVASTALDGWPVEIRDTAGLRAVDEEIEAQGVTRAQAEIAAADLVLLVADTTAPWDEPLYEQVTGLLAARSSRSLLVVHNKVDLAPAPVVGCPDGTAVSARLGLGIDELCQRVVAALIPTVPPRGSAIPITEEQVQQLENLLKRARSETP